MTESDISEKFQMRVPSADLAMWREVAAREGVSLSAMIVSAVNASLGVSGGKVVGRTVSERLTALRGDRRSGVVDRSVHHVSGPVLSEVVPAVVGDAVGFNPKKSWKADRS